MGEPPGGPATLPKHGRARTRSRNASKLRAAGEARLQEDLRAAASIEAGQLRAVGGIARR